MGKALVIKGADFSENAFATVELSPVIPTIREDLTSLFTWEDGKVNQGDGVVVVSTFYKVSNMVDISGLLEIKIAQPMYRTGPIVATYPTLSFFDANEEFLSSVFYNISDISGSPSMEIATHQIPQGAKYLRTNLFLDSYMETWPDGHYIDFSCIGIKPLSALID